MGNGPSDEASVVLVGFMASGKTVVGRELARIAGWRLVDVDARIEAETGMDIPAVFRTLGEPWFRRREAEVTRRALDLGSCVVVPGGGWGAQPGALEDLPGHVLSVWLRVDAEAAVARARKDGPGRPLLDAAEDPVVRARSLLTEREPHYRRAALHVDTEGRPPEDVAREILEHLRRGRASANREP